MVGLDQIMHYFPCFMTTAYGMYSLSFHHSRVMSQVVNIHSKSSLIFKSIPLFRMKFT
jgi:hypothetical protein